MASQLPSPGYTRALDSSHHKEILGTETSDPILLSAASVVVSAGVFDVTTGARIEFTIDTHAAIEADSALWAQWASGNVTSNTIEKLNGPVSGVRAVSIGAATWMLLISKIDFSPHN